MTRLLDRLVLDRTGPADATVGLISLPIPRDLAADLRVDHAASAMHPVGWWVRNRLPRRSLAWVVDPAGVPSSLRLTTAPAPKAPASNAPRWDVRARVSRQKMEFTPRPFNQIADLRGVPYEETTYVEYELLLSYGSRTLALQFGATGPQGGPFWWQNAQVDPLWETPVVKAVRVGGVIYNGDTYLWADVYLLLFSHGVADVAVHFVNTKLHIEGYDFQGLPVIRFASSQAQGLNLPALDARLPDAGERFNWPGLQLNLADMREHVSAEHPGRLTGPGGEILWRPWCRTFNPQLPAAPDQEWAPGFARTARFQLSLADNVAPAVARYRAPSWWYTAAGEPWSGDFLPVQSRFARLGELTSDHIRTLMSRGRFDAYSAAHGNDGDAGIGLMRNAHRTGRTDLYADALNYCFYWADLAVDHRDYSVHQWIGGWGWKTCAYSKFRDVFIGYLETGDPCLLDTALAAAEQYWTWFRSNWPRCTIGRDAFEIGGWALLRRFLNTEHARERSREFLRMLKAVVDDRGAVGGQLGAGPHPGYHASLYMTGVAMLSTLDVIEAELEEDPATDLTAAHQLLATLSSRFLRDDVELFPSNMGQHRPVWHAGAHGTWAALAMRAYSQMARLPGVDPALVAQGLAKLQACPHLPLAEWAGSGRLGNQLVNPLYHDAMLLGARWTGQGVELNPLASPEHWSEEQTIDTPAGAMTLRAQRGPAGQTSLTLSAPAAFPVTIRLPSGAAVKTTSQAQIAL